MKFQDSSFNEIKVTVGTKSVTHPRTHPRTHAPKAICPINFFKVGGIIKKKSQLYVKTASASMTLNLQCIDIYNNILSIITSLAVFKCYFISNSKQTVKSFNNYSPALKKWGLYWICPVCPSVILSLCNSVIL